MPRLCLFRHAKSNWSTGASSDFDRSISARGERDAPLISAHLVTEGWRPDRVLCSPAKRARQTLAAAAGFFHSEPEILFPAGLYDASQVSYISLIRSHGGDAEILMIIGHNPMTHETALRLAVPGTSPAATGLERKFPTSALAVLDFDTAWSDLADHSGTLLAFVKPADLKA